jgi:ABC-type cobalt transport system substrate-binding protein
MGEKIKYLTEFLKDHKKVLIIIVILLIVVFIVIKSNKKEEQANIQENQIDDIQTIDNFDEFENDNYELDETMSTKYDGLVYGVE